LGKFRNPVFGEIKKPGFWENLETRFLGKFRNPVFLKNRVSGLPVTNGIFIGLVSR
jgi:hypothetical protein